MPDYYYETTPYGVKEVDGKFCVRQMWWDKTISTHDTEDEARLMCIEIANENGYLKKRRIKTNE